MERAEIKADQQPVKQQISELNADITKLTAQRAGLEQENYGHSPLVRQLGKYLGFGAARKLEWVCFKLSYKQEELARLVRHPDERENEVATLLSMVPARPSETTRQKMKRMITENPSALEPYIRRVYQSVLKAEQ